ncbi:hypothetical protein [Flavobacterium fluviatile]|uniref:hypothetical protein n=1 Tax=Flavobacterium fluviatile TaxID=1862387 RepID=UPI0013CFAD74|nr:hypothetical protein [Flavobacterium fluviatile]
MTNKYPKIGREHEFDTIQNHVETDYETNKKMNVIAISLLIFLFSLLFVVWSFVFSIPKFA